MDQEAGRSALIPPLGILCLFQLPDFVTMKRSNIVSFFNHVNMTQHCIRAMNFQSRISGKHSITHR